MTNNTPEFQRNFPGRNTIFFSFFEFSLPSSQKKRRVQPAELGEKLPKKESKIGGEIFDFSRLNTIFSKILTSAG